jgi:polar amino acid transport system substrate-binding protein
MNIVKSFLFMALWVFTFVTSSLFSQANAEDLDVIIGDWSPYIDRSLSNQGLISEIVIKSFEKVGINANLIYKPWKRVELDVDKRDSVSFGWIWNKEREDKWQFSNEIGISSSVFVARKDSNISWRTYEDLRPYQIGITRGYSHGSAFDDFKSQFMIQEVSKDEHNLRKLLKKRIDLFAVDPMVGARLLRTKFSLEERNQLKFIMEPAIATHGIYVVCAKTYKKCSYYLDKFNEGMDSLIKNDIK